MVNIIRTLFCIVFWGVTIFLLQSCDSAQQYTESYFPPPLTEGGWRKNTSKEFVEFLGLDYQALQTLGRYALSVKNSSIIGYDDHNHASMIFIKNGWIVGEWYLRPESRTYQQYLSSNGKTFAYVLFGILMKEAKQGLLPVKELSEQDKLYNPLWLSEGYPLSDPRKAGITFEQVFRHTAGFIPETTADGKQVETGRYHWGSNYINWVVGHDSLFPLTGKLFFDPGKPEQYPDSEQWGQHRGAYSSLGFAHLGIAFRHISGHNADENLWYKLLEPIGFDGYSCHYPPSSGSNRWFTGGGLSMTARNYARFAYLLMKKGRWQNKQLVDPEWINRAFTSPNYQNLRSNVDGYLSEQYPPDLMRIYGSGGNFAYIIPSMDIIALHTGRCSNSLAELLQRKFLVKMLDVIQEDRKSGKD
jgi:hypothetical protein